MKKICLLISALILVALGAYTQEKPNQEQPVPEQKVSDVSPARLSFLSGKIFLQRAADLAYEEVTVNTPIADGDRLGTLDGRAEVSFGQRRFVRLDNDSKIDFQTLPRTNSSRLRLRLWSGHIYLDLGALEREKDVEVLTSNATFYFLEKGLYRIDVEESGRTEILVFNGLVEAAGEEGSILVKAEQRLSLAEGRFDGRPASFFAGAEDAFDRWNLDRSAITNRTYAQRHLPEDLEEYESELDEYGDWVEMDPHGSVWVPRGMGMDWRPYSYGRWTWLPVTGWCWIPYEPWGWSTFHYGRWHWHLGYGWYWIPMSGWGPGWVNWWWNDYYYGWAPMSYWGYPGILYHNMYYGRGWNRDYPYDSRALTVVRKDQLQAPDAGRAALKGDALRSVGRMDLTKTTLNVRPAQARPVQAVPLEGNRGTILLRNKGDAAGGVDPKILRDDPKNAEKTGERVIRSADPARISSDGKTSGTAGGAKAAPRVVERSGNTSARSPERRIRKKDGSESMGITPFPSSSRITRESAGGRVSSTNPLMNRIYRYFQGSRESSGSRGTSGSGPSRSVSSGSNRGSTPSRSASSSSRSGSSRSGSSPSRSGSSSRSSGGSVRKK